MLETPLDLADAFPDHVAYLSPLTRSDRRFARLVDQFRSLSRAVQLAERDEPEPDQTAAARLRRDHLSLRNEIDATLRRAYAATVGA